LPLAASRITGALDILKRRGLGTHRKTQQPRKQEQDCGKDEWKTVNVTHLELAHGG
jgi:hypothetical protein